jgi:CO dehydrogenase/acetyl-CoA synthase alpha subunit
MARGAAVGGVSVLAAGAASAAVAATGVAVVGAPIVVPIVSMVTVGALVGREIDRRLAPPPPALPG